MDSKRIWNHFVVPVLENMIAPYSVLRKILLQIILLGIAVYLNALIFIVYQHLDWISAIYAGVNVITTVGLYAPNISQMPSTEKLFLILTIIFAVGLYTSIIQAIVSTVVKRSSWIDAKARWRGTHMKGHTVLIGHGNVIISAVKRMEKLGVDYVVLTHSSELASKISGDKVVLGDPKDDKNLLSAGIKEAKNAIISMGDDMETLVITLKVQKLNPPLQVISVIKDPSLTDVFKTGGADLVIPYDEIVGRITAAAAVSNNVAGIVFPDRSEENFVLGIVQVRKKAKINELPKDIVPLIIIRGNQLDPYFSRDAELKEGEQLVVLGNPNLFKKIRELLE
ncbi:TrkA family potassium uptake protein [Acidianus sp. RZ1]|uniref:potassium channel family protein n=1 Tax=Acidianus sp. RZ1 TaxID=1540082 RepID=UPI00149287B7|nr:NAD(P)-binding protein [Acidianus sp. RZ1]NON62662.1 NAD-binding protein [Acidianus sp. RZ1]